MKKATRLEEVNNAFQKQPLDLSDLQFFQETEIARGNLHARKQLMRSLSNTEVDNKILYFGYKGCGKSTELRKLQSDIQERCLVINFSVFTELDPTHLQYIEIFIVTMERLFKVANDNDIYISQEYLTDIQNWIGTKEITELKDKYVGSDAELGIKGALTIPLVLNFFSKLRASTKSSLSLKEQLKIVIEPRLSDLIDLCNLLISEIRIQLTESNTKYKDILLIIEDMDKVPITRVKDIFINYVGQLTLLKCNCIFTFPLSLRCSPLFEGRIKPFFTSVVELPMIEVRNKDGAIVEEGMRVMRAIVGARMDLALFSNDSILDKIILNSGGCLRDFFSMIKDAAENAINYDRNSIVEEDYLRAYNSLKKDYKSGIADYYKEDKSLISVADFYSELEKVANNPKKDMQDETEILMILRESTMILGYNGVGWCDVHPVVRDILQDRVAAQALPTT